MVGIKDSAVGTKTTHVLNQLWMGLKRGAQIGAVGGAIVGVGAVLTGTAAVTIPAVIGYAVFGAVAGSLFGMNTGGFVGGIKGLITRSRPNGDKLMKNAEDCAVEAPPAPSLEPETGKEQAQAPAKAPEEKKPDAEKAPAGSVSVTNANAANAPSAGAVPKEALAELKAMTDTLNQIQGNVAASEAAPQEQAQPQPQNWQARVQQEAAQAETAERQR